MTEENTSKAYFAAGCFWGVEAAFRQVEGVVETSVGYMGGHAENPTYEAVCRGNTGHAEAVEVTFDPSRVSYDDLLLAFWACHDPTQLNRQGPDVGTQYRSAVYTVNGGQNDAARTSQERLGASGKFGRPIVTGIESAGPYWRAEEYHQQYCEKRMGGVRAL